MAQVEIRDTICPYCNGTKFVKAKQSGYATLTSCESIWLGGDIYHIICLRCGSVVRSFVKEPEQLIKRKKRTKE